MLALASLVKTRLKGRYAPALGDFSFGVISMAPVGRGQNEIEGATDVCENTRHLQQSFFTFSSVCCVNN